MEYKFNTICDIAQCFGLHKFTDEDFYDVCKNSIYDIFNNKYKMDQSKFNPDTIKNVHFDDVNKATIVYWIDGTKTVVVCQKDDEYNKEMGLAMAILKKICGTPKKFNDIFKKWCPDLYF